MPKVCPSCELTYSDEDFFCAADGAPLRSTGAEADNLVGTVIADRYRVESILGEGGMGRVYRARHVRVPREAAIKVLRRALIADAYAVAAFNREARNAASVGDHPHVAAVYDFGETSDGLVFLAMEFIEGETLTRCLEREPVLPPSRAVEIVRQVAAGLSAAHELPEPVVHRDLKPDNILLKATRDGSDWVKLVDFGIAKAAKRDTQMLTTPGLVVGTPRYMSPEQLTGAPVDTRSDIYALGIIAYQMLTGRMPFPSTSREEEVTISWALQRLTTEPLRLAEIRPEVDWPEAAEDALARALAKDPAQRPPTAAALAQSLARAFGLSTPSSVVGVVAGTPGPLSSALQAAARAAAPTAPITAAPGSFAPASATLPAAVSTRPLSPAPAPSTSGETIAGPTGASGTSRRIALVAGVVLVAAAVGAVWAFRDRSESSVPGPSTPNDSVVVPATGGSGVATAADSPKVALPAADSARPPADAGTKASAISERGAGPTTPGVNEPPMQPRALETNARVRLDQIKASLADQAPETAPGVLRTINRLLPQLRTRDDSVEATYYSIEANLILDRTSEACRLLNGVRRKSEGTDFEVRIARILADPDLGCETR
jgi:eukaryotic-like serine/threonine-protein kinase